MSRQSIGKTTKSTACPMCGAALKATIAERVLQPLGTRKADIRVEGGHRDEYHCGAVRLTNKENPDGTMEATCCVIL